MLSLSTLVPLDTTGNATSGPVFQTDGNDSSLQPPGPPTGLVGSREKLVVENVLEVGISLVFSIFGIVGNAVSIFIFARLGYKETINISMTFICGWDFARCVLASFRKMYGVIRPIDPVLAMSWSGVSYMTIGYMSLAAIYVSGVLAGYVAVERCLCVSKPLAVRFLLTPTVVLTNNVIVSLLVVGSFLVVFPCIKFVQVPVPHLNATVWMWTNNQFFYDNPVINTFLNVIGIFWLSSSFAVICVCTAIIASKLKKASKFKMQHSNVQQQGGGGGGGGGGSGGKGISDRDKQVIKLLLVMLVVYICVGLPRITIFIFRAIFPQFDPLGSERNMFNIMMYLASSIDYFNCDVNIVVFYVMSTHFKKKFRATFCEASENKQIK